MYREVGHKAMGVDDSTTDAYSTHATTNVYLKKAKLNSNSFALVVKRWR
jgi:hypothetical protein